jgi:8-oxo-dGTP pyrophosphatase MutT (NUDIX family)
MRIKRTPVFRGKIIEVDLETVKLPNGTTAELEIVHHPGGAAALALDDEERVCLLRQYRHAATSWLWEMPAGKLDPGETPVAAARRELQEEAGLRAGDWSSLGLLVSSPGVFTEVIHLYLARQLEPAPHDQEPHEVIEVHWIPLTQALAWACNGEIVDAKTLVGLFRAYEFLERENKFSG